MANVVVLKDPPPVTIPDGLTQEEIKKAIELGMRLRGWRASEKGPNQFIATLYIRTHIVKELITVNDKTISFSYLYSSNMKYIVKEPDTDEELYGEELKPVAHIHRAYNGWVINLANDIKNQLLATASGKSN